ncbi:MAG: glycosyltransferase family 4 protein [bacterium]
MDDLRIAYILEEPTSWILDEIKAVERTGVRVLVCLCNWQRENEVDEQFWQVRVSVCQFLRALFYFLSRLHLEFFCFLLSTKAKIGLRLTVRLVYFAYVSLLNDINHIHAHFAATATTVAKGISKLTGLPYSFTAHAYDLFKTSVDRRDFEEKIVWAEFVRTVSQFHLNYINSINGKAATSKIKVLSYGVDTACFRPRQVEREPQFTILTVANLVPKKGLSVLIEACAILSTQVSNWKAIVVGDGPLRASLERQIDQWQLAKRIALPGAVAHSELCAIYNSCDVFVLPCVKTADGDRDGLPNVLLEAMATGKPVISTPVAGIPELITDGKTGLLVPENNARALSNAIVWLMRNPNKAQEIAQEGRTRVLEEFNLVNTAERLNFLFRQTCLLARCNGA